MTCMQEGATSLSRVSHFTSDVPQVRDSEVSELADVGIDVVK